VQYYRSSESWFRVADGKQCAFYGYPYGASSGNIGYYPCNWYGSSHQFEDSANNIHPQYPWSPGVTGATYWGITNLNTLQLTGDTSLVPNTTYYYRAKADGPLCPSFPVAINFSCGENANPQPISARQIITPPPTLRRLCIFNWCF
jgi:hypothetical protein